jgi:hypothetical protein
LTAANGRLLAAEFTMNQFVGPPLGGLLAAVGLGIAFGTQAAGYLAAGLLIAGLAGSFRQERTGPATRIHEEIREGIAYLARHRLLRVLAVVIALLNLAQGAVWAIFVLYVVAPGPMGLDEVGFGLLLTATAVGTILGTLVAGVIEQRLGKPNLFAVCVVVLAAGNVALASSTNPLVVGTVLAVGGLFLGAFNVTYQSLRQRIVPDRILGRLVATFRMLGWGALPLGAIVGGVVGEAFGLTAVFWAAAVMTIVLLPARLLVTDARIAEAEDDTVAERAASPASVSPPSAADS